MKEIEQATANIEQFLNSVALKKAEYDLLFNSLKLLYEQAKNTNDVPVDLKKDETIRP